MNMRILIYSLFVISVLSACDEYPSGVSYEDSKKMKQNMDSIKMSRGKTSFSLEDGGPFATMNQIAELARNSQIYYTDPRTNLCFAATSSRTSYDHLIVSITCVTCDSLKNKDLRIFVLKSK